MPSSVELELVDSHQQSSLWNSLIAEYHYLGLTTPVGRLIRYIVKGDGQTLGGISFSEPAWSITARDEVLCDFGIARKEIRSTVIANNRFLILPCVRVRNLASRVLAVATKQAIADWYTRFLNQPQFIETFVDPRRFEGTCYRAANWSVITTTKGFAKKGASHNNRRAPKLLLMVGTTYNTQRYLLNRFLEGHRRAA